MKRIMFVICVFSVFTFVVSAQEKQQKSGHSTADETVWTSGIVSDTTNSTDTTVFIITDARMGRHETFDRIVLEFSKSGIPNYFIAYVDMPVRRCGSAEPVPLPGEGWLMIRLYPARMHKNGKSTVEKRDVKLDFPVLLRAATICDYEATVEWVAALVSPNPYRVMQLDSPPRLVIDISHR